jgi:hypothetical protein
MNAVGLLDVAPARTSLFADQDIDEPKNLRLGIEEI